MAEKTAWRTVVKKPLGPTLRGTATSSIYDPSRARHPYTTQSEASPSSPGLNKARQWGNPNPWDLDNRSIRNDTGNRMGSFASSTKNAAPTRANVINSGLHNLGSTQSGQSNRTDVTINALRRDEKIYTRAYYDAGVIFSTAHHVQDQELGPLPPDSIRTESNAGRIISKYRKFIVVSTYHYHCVAIPLFTHEGKGLASKPPVLLEEFVSVRDKNNSGTGSTKGDTKHGILWVQNKGYESGFAATSHLSNAQLSHPFSHSYNKPCIMHTKLDKESTEKLTKLYLQCMDRGLDTMFKRMGIDDGNSKVQPSTKKAEKVLDAWNR